MSYNRLVELCENLTVDNYNEWESLLNELFDEREIKLIRKNSRLGFIDEVKYIKSRARYLKFKKESNLSNPLKFDQTLENVQEQMDVLFEDVFSGRGEVND